MAQQSIQDVIAEMLAARGNTDSIEADEPIFTSGLLDSLAATELMMTLEGDFGIDLADADFDISKLDTLEELESLVKQAA
jgi:acyl carrier protein